MLYFLEMGLVLITHISILTVNFWAPKFLLTCMASCTLSLYKDNLSIICLYRVNFSHISLSILLIQFLKSWQPYFYECHLKTHSCQQCRKHIYWLPKIHSKKNEKGQSFTIKIRKLCHNNSNGIYPEYIVSLVCQCQFLFW